MPLDCLDIMKEANRLIRAGQRHEAIRSLTNFPLIKVPRRHLLEFANLARRTGLFHIGLRALQPLVRPKGKTKPKANAAESAAYAMLLSKIGARSEARRLLESHDDKLPEKHLYLGFISMASWDYEAAAVHLTNYLSLNHGSPYDRMVAEVNLIASLVTLGNENASVRIEAALAQSSEAGWTLLEQNLTELKVQMLVAQKKWHESFEHLDRLATRRDPQNSNYQIFNKKWMALAKLQELGPTAETISGLAEVSRIAAAEQHWETVRDCAYQESLATRNRELFLRVYFGTPLAAFRSRMKTAAREWIQLPAAHEIYFGDHSVAARSFNLWTGEESGAKVQLKAGKAMHKILAALFKDLYRPKMIGDLFAEVYPGEYFDPQTSALKISQLVFRLRKWVEQNAVPITVEVKDELYQVHVHGDYKLIVHAEAPIAESASGKYTNQILLLKLQREWQRDIFSTREACNLLSLSPRTLQNIFDVALRNNMIEKIGQGAATRYRFTDEVAV